MDGDPPEQGIVKRRNQHLPCPPEHLIRGVIQVYYSAGQSDKSIAELARKHFDTTLDTTVKRLRKKWGLAKTRKQAHTLETIHPYLVEMKKTYPERGATKLTQALRLTHSVWVPRELVSEWLRQNEPEAVERRKHRKFKRHRFWSAGLNDFWTFDQHDKWGPRMVAIPLVTQSDAGTDNFGIANAHTTIRHRLDPTLADTLQHRWMGKLMNIKPEIAWSLLNRDWKPGFEAILEHGVAEGWYDPNDHLESFIFRYLAIPWLQAELDQWREQFNMTPRHTQRNKSLPQGIPYIIAQNPEKYNIHDFKIEVPMTIIDEVEMEWAPPDHLIFELVPELFQERIQTFLQDLGNPVLNADTFWIVYVSVLGRFVSPNDGHVIDPTIINAVQQNMVSEQGIISEPLAIIPGLRQLRQGDRLVGDRVVQPPEVEGEPILDEDGDMIGFGLFTDEEEELDGNEQGML
uniref:N/A n=1 Tax=Ganoderma boninense TaxID=34458 RepID=A0A5K1K7Q0_9APHY|nr:N/A [Ganoderma boninense]